jgi:CDGSH-type Zn-finger protein
LLSSSQLKRVIKAGPVKYIAPEDRDVWFCNCKQTKNRPFCDGSHRSEEIQEARIPAKFEMWEPREKPTE